VPYSTYASIPIVASAPTVTAPSVGRPRISVLVHPTDVAADRTVSTGSGAAAHPATTAPPSTKENAHQKRLRIATTPHPPP
jgi:hypothetical protein